MPRPAHLIPMTLALLLALAPDGAVARAADATGTITGTLDPPGGVATVVAIDRSTDKKYPGTVDAGSGRFTVAGLPLGATFDCLIDCQGGARLEGVNLKVPRSEYEEEQPLSAEDIATIKEKVLHLNKFEDEVDVLGVAGNIQNAAVLINKLRTRPFVNSKPGEVVWRCELWRFERPEETWVKVQDELFLVLYRARIPRAEYDKKAVTFDPALGGLAVTRETPTVHLGPVKPPPAAPGVRLRTGAGERQEPGKSG